MLKKISFLVFLFVTISAFAQEKEGYWQQHVDYTMDVTMDVNNYQYKGEQELVYTNNSPDTLKQVFYHLYPNAFQSGSEMDVRSRTIADPDPRVMDRISKLEPDEIGYLKVKNLTQDGNKVEAKTIGTILQVKLAQPLLPGRKTTFSLKFDGQVPVQIRRSGRNNAEGVALSMAQWYPKLAEYDYEGWHADPYIAREFYGVWGDFDVKITLDKNYVLGGTGYLQNPDEIGYGYQKKGKKVRRKGETLTWHFVAPHVHDFTWAADPDYIHDQLTTDDGTVLHFLYKNKASVIKNWKKFAPKAATLYQYFNKHIGYYPYKQYSFIQGGDGGMEYAMCTLINGDKKFESLLGTAAHEFAHSWFQFVLATNESEHAWMDEGFTSYISTKAMNSLRKEPQENPFVRYYKIYRQMANSGQEETEATHSDRYKTNGNYSTNAYVKGSIFLSQLGYIIGEDNLEKSLHAYYDQWQFKHPTPNDFIRVVEKISGAQLGWYLNDWIRTTNTVDYGVKNVIVENDSTKITLKRIGLIPMPLDIQITFTDNSTEKHYIPLRMMYWQKPNAGTIEQDWPWTNPTYSFRLKTDKKVKKVEIDPSQMMADVDRENNVYYTP